MYTREEHSIRQEQIDRDALTVIRRLRDAGFSAYVVGGAVRDLLVGNVPKDFDIVTDATPSRIKRLFRNSRIIGRRFRLVHVFFGPKIFEVSTFRSIAEGSTGNNFGTMDEDVLRRDFTMNALYFDPMQEQIIDYVGGVRDIKKRQLAPVISLDRIFEEDPVRMLRAVKYAATTEARMPHSLRHKIKKSGNLLRSVSPSRLTEELLKIINSGHSYDIVREAVGAELYEYLQPAAAALMLDSRAFETQYMRHLQELDAFSRGESDARLGKKLAFLIKDFVLTLTDWSTVSSSPATVGELYHRTWAECRRFVLPMNPQRTELDYAVRSVLTELGVQSHSTRRHRSRRTVPV